MKNPKAWLRLLTPMKVVTDSDAMPGGGGGPHLPPTTYHLRPLFSATFPLSASIPFVFIDIPASAAVFQARSFVFINIPASVVYFQKLSFSFSAENGLAVHLSKGSSPGFWARLGRSGMLRKNASLVSF